LWPRGAAAKQKEGYYSQCCGKGKNAVFKGLHSFRVLDIHAEKVRITASLAISDAAVSYAEEVNSISRAAAGDSLEQHEKTKGR
jgi:hypothetical protein